MVFLKDIRDITMIEREGKKIEQFFHQFEVGEYVKYSVTASVGAAVFPGDGKSFEELYKAADNALYVSKRHGKNQLSFYKKPENETKQGDSCGICPRNAGGFVQSDKHFEKKQTL